MVRTVVTRTKVRAWDTETGTAVLWGQKASPWHPDNYIVAEATLDTTGELRYRYNTKAPGHFTLGWALDEAKLVAGFNLKFDLLHHLVNKPQNQETFRMFLAEGGLLWDCQLAEFLLGGQAPEHQMTSLEEVSVRYGGSLKHDEVKALWEQGVNTPDIPEPLLKRYLAGGENPKTGAVEPGDVQNTLTIFKGQWKRAKEQDMMPLLVMNMKAYAYTVLCKLWGMHVDLDVAAQQQAELEAEIATCRAELDKHVKELPFTFNWGSYKQRSALLFGGSIPYDATEYLGTMLDDPRDPTTEVEVWWCPERDGEKPAGWEQKYTPKVEKHVRLLDGRTVLREQWEQMVEPPAVECFKSGQNAGQPKPVNVSLPDPGKPKKRQCVVEHKMPRMVQPRPEWASSEPGIWSTASEVIEALEHSGLDFTKHFARWQKQTKDLGTYYQSVSKEGKPQGMLTLVAVATKLVHGELNMVTAITARLTASRPNTQNLPRFNEDNPEGSRVKQVFTSRWGPDGRIIQDDFSSLEVYCQANLSRCAALLADLEKGLDLHCVRLSAWKEVDYDEVVRRAKGPEATAEWKSLRTDAKVFSFRRAYGAGAQTISDGTGIPIPQVEELIAAEQKRWPGIEPYYEQLTKEIKRNRQPGGRFIPHPDKPTIMCQLGTSFARTPDGKKYVYTEHPAPKWMLDRKGGPTTSFSPTEIRNYVVQGAGAEVAKAAMAVIAYTWARDAKLFYKAPIINQVHDAFYVDAHPAVAEAAAINLHACVLEASTLIKKRLGWDIAIDYPAEIHWGPSMADEASVPEAVLAQVPAARARIRATI